MFVQCMCCAQATAALDMEADQRVQTVLEARFSGRGATVLQAPLGCRGSDIECTLPPQLKHLPRMEALP